MNPSLWQDGVWTSDQITQFRIPLFGEPPCTIPDVGILTRADLAFLIKLGMKPTMTIYPFFIHAIFMSIFASVIGPFGGFFASGFKRAFKIKVRQMYVA